MATATLETLNGNIGPEMLLREYFNQVYVPDRLITGSHHTLEHYEKAIRAFGHTLKRPPKLSDLNTENIRNALAAWEIEGERKLTALKEHTRKRYRVALCCLWRHAARRKLIPADYFFLDTPGIGGFRNGGRKDGHALSRFNKLLSDDAEQHDGETSLAKFFDKVYRPRRLLQSSPHVVYKYKRWIAALGDVLGRPPLVSDLNEENILRLAEAALQAGRAPGTANDGRKALVALGNLAVKRGVLKSFDEVAKLKVPVASPTSWQPEDLRRLMQTIVDSTEGRKLGRLPARWFWESLIRLIMDTGVRLGAMVKTEWRDIDLVAGILTVRPECQKDRTGQRFTLKPTTVAALRQIVEPERELVFELPQKCKKSALFYRMHQFLERAGLAHGRRDLFHRLRRTVASWYERAGGNATDLLGHSARDTTRLYLDPTVATKVQASDVMFDIPLDDPAKGGVTNV